VIAAAAVLAVGLATAPALAAPVPPPAPKPTSHGKSPEAPDPHPPLGGHAPDGTPVGGSRLLHRGLILPRGAPALPKHLTARSWVVADLDTGAVLAACDPHGRYQPASIQKLLTTLTLLPLLPGGRTVTVTRRAANTEGSHAGLVAGGRYTVDDLFRGLLLVSGNDAAEALADAAGGRRHTVALMNAEARRLGAYDTYVQTPSGLDGWQQLTSAYDMTLVLRAVLRQPRFVRYDRVLHAVLPRQRSRHVGAMGLWNQNTTFLTTVKGAIAAKTGYTDAAQHTFVGAVERNGHRYGVVFMRAQRWPLDQWQQAVRLVNWAARLRVGTEPVGRLVTPTVPKTAHPTGDAQGQPPSPARRLGAGSRVTGRDGAGLGLWLGLSGLIVGLLIVGGLAYTGLRRRGRLGRQRRGPGAGQEQPAGDELDPHQHGDEPGKGAGGGAVGGVRHDVRPDDLQHLEADRRE
jgi:D-alanyl-D-alanine carboxypeptidase (penicillin-binding protein 5/6)